MFFQSLLPNFNIQEFAAPVAINEEGANQGQENNAIEAFDGEGELRLKIVDWNIGNVFEQRNKAFTCNVTIYSAGISSRTICRENPV